MLNVLVNGTISVGAEVYRHWRGVQFQAADLDDFLGESGVVRDCMDAMVDSDKIFYFLQGGSLTLKSAGMDTLLLADKLKERYTLVNAEVAHPIAPGA